MKNITRPIIVALFCIFSLSSCYKPYEENNINKQVPAKEQLGLEDSAKELKLWQTNDLSIYYNAVDNGKDITLSGYAEVYDRVILNFPRVDFFYIYVYQLDQDGIYLRRDTIRPDIAWYNNLFQKNDFSKTIPKDSDTVSFAFGYWGNFVDSERETENGRSGVSSTGWDIYHNPFKQ